MIGTHKGIYHSTLASFGPAYVTVKSDVLQSKKKGSYFVVLEHEGEEQFYNVENDACGDALRNLKGKSITIKAEGSRDDATIKILNSDGTHEAPAQRTASKPSRSESPDMNKELTKMMNIFYIIEDSVKRESEQSEVNGVPFDAANFGGKCSQTFRELYHEGVFDSVPNDRPIWSSEKKNATGEYEF